jgi:WD40 repeat protein
MIAQMSKGIGFLLGVLFACSLHAQNAETWVQLGHSDRVSCVDLTPDARYAVTGSSDNTMKLWNISNGQLLRTFHGHHGLVYAAQVSPDGKAIYSCSWDDRKTIKWDAVNGKQLAKYVNYTDPINYISLSPDGKLLAGRTDAGVVILNTSNLGVNKKISITKPGKMKFSADGKLLYIAIEDFSKEKIVAYNIATGTEAASYPGIYSPEALDIGATKMVLSNYKEVAVLDLVSKKEVLRISKDSLRFNSACMNPAGTQFAYSLEDGSMVVKSIDGSPVKDVNGKPILFEKKHLGIINQMHFSADGRFLVTASNDWTSKVYSVSTGKVVRNLASLSEYIQSISLSGTGNYLAVASGHVELGNHIGVWDLTKGRLLPWFPKVEGSSFFTSVAFSQRNKSIGASNVNGNMYWYAFPASGYSGSMNMNNQAVMSVALTPNGKNYIGGTRDGKILVWRPDRNKSEDFLADKGGISSISVSPDATKFVAGTAEGKVLIYDYESRTLLQTIESHSLSTGYYDTSNVMAYGSSASISLDGGFAMRYASVMSVTYSPDNRMVAACGGSWVKVFDVVAGRLVSHIKQYGAGFCTVNFSSDGKYICTGGADFTVRIYEVSSGALVKSFAGHQNEVRTVLFSGNGKHLISGSLDTQIKIWDIASGKEYLTYIILAGGNDYVITNPQGYYFATKGAAKVLSFRVGNEVYPFEQFDLKYNRPDIILGDISGFAYADEKSNPDVPLIKSYYVAYQKRLKRAGFVEKQLGTDFHVPMVSINNNEIPLSTKQGSLSFRIKAEDNLYNLKSLNIWVNDVPVYGARGKQVSGKILNEVCSIQLSNEKNKVTVSCMNEKGAESYRETFEIVYEGGTVNYKTYFIGIGVSTYKDSEFNLKYAEKDVKDLGKAMEEKNAEVILLTNENATRENILKLKEKLMKTGVNDKVIVSLSGHGLLGKDLDFYYATFDVDFKHPEKNGLLYEDLENLLDGIPARNKLILVDACHSGEVDKTENIQLTEGKPKEGVTGTAARGSALIVDSNSVGLDNSFELMQDLFRDISSGNGAVVISAAGGLEYALESAQWNNGVFTYCVLNAMKSGAADSNKDNKITVAELKEYVSSQVQILTGGKQKPTSRRENIANDWIFW